MNVVALSQNMEIKVKNYKQQLKKQVIHQVQSILTFSIRVGLW